MNQMKTHLWHTLSKTVFILLPSLFILISCTGCNVLGAAAQVLPPATILPKYTGLAGQNVAVMVWADRGIRTVYSGLPVYLDASIQNALKQNLKEKVLKDAKF